MKWVLLGKEKFRQTRCDYFWVDLIQLQKIIQTSSKKVKIFTTFLDFYPHKNRGIFQIFKTSCAAVFQLSPCKFCRHANRINLFKISKNMVFWLIFCPKIGFLRFYPRTISPIILKPLSIDSTVKNTSSKVYLGSLTYRADNTRKSLYYQQQCSYSHNVTIGYSLLQQ